MTDLHELFREVERVPYPKRGACPECGGEAVRVDTWTAGSSRHERRVCRNAHRWERTISAEPAVHRVSSRAISSLHSQEIVAAWPEEDREAYAEFERQWADELRPLPQHDLDAQRRLGRDVEWEQLRKWLSPKDVTAQAVPIRRRAVTNSSQDPH